MERWFSSPVLFPPFTPTFWLHTSFRLSCFLFCFSSQPCISLSLEVPVVPLFKADAVFEAERSTTLKTLPSCVMDFFVCYLAEDTCSHRLHFYQSMISVDSVTLPMGRLSMSVGKASYKSFLKFILAHGLFNQFSV